MKHLKTLLLLLLVSITAFSQEENVDQLLDEFLFGKNAQDSLIDSILANEVNINDLLRSLENYSYIYARSELENKTYFSGQDLGINQYNISTQIFYQGKKGFNIGMAGILYSGFKPKYNTTIATIGYNNSIPALKNLSLRISYNRFFFAKVDSIESYSFNSSFNLGGTYQLKNIGTSVDFSLLLGKEPTTQVSWDLFSEFTLFRFGLFNKIKITPELSFYFGNETIVISQYVNRLWYRREILS